MSTKAETVVAALRKHGPSTCEELSAITGFKPDDISSMLREFKRRRKYGLVNAGTTRVHNIGNARKVVAIDETAYQAYMAKRKEREIRQAELMLERRHPVVPVRDFPRPITQFHTRWQPASPYYQEAA